MTLGPIMLDLRGTTLEADEHELLKHPLVGGVILFSRNYESVEQITKLVCDIHSLREPRLLVSVDHEGGRVQRFRQGFTELPACRVLGKKYESDKETGLALAEKTGWLMAAELRAVDVDFSFAPVLDLYKGISQVIGDRAFHRQPTDAANMARRYMKGMREAGMAAIGKHFPGHGAVVEDSHLAIPIDKRRYEDIQMDDMIAFQQLIDSGLPAIMPAHVIYPAVDDKPAGFSPVWLKQILRQGMNFKGTIFSDDISMAGAEVIGDYLARSEAALEAGCDMVLICNHQKEAIQVIDHLQFSINPTSSVRLMQLHGKFELDRKKLCNSDKWHGVVKDMQALIKTPELDLGDDGI